MLKSSSSLSSIVAAGREDVQRARDQSAAAISAHTESLPGGPVPGGEPPCSNHTAHHHHHKYGVAPLVDRRRDRSGAAVSAAAKATAARPAAVPTMKLSLLKQKLASGRSGRRGSTGSVHAPSEAVGSHTSVIPLVTRAAASRQTMPATMKKKKQLASRHSYHVPTRAPAASTSDIRRSRSVRIPSRVTAGAESEHAAAPMLAREFTRALKENKPHRHKHSRRHRNGDPARPMQSGTRVRQPSQRQRQHRRRDAQPGAAVSRRQGRGQPAMQHHVSHRGVRVTVARSPSPPPPPPPSGGSPPAAYGGPAGDADGAASVTGLPRSSPSSLTPPPLSSPPPAPPVARVLGEAACVEDLHGVAISLVPDSSGPPGASPGDGAAVPMAGNPSVPGDTLADTEGQAGSPQRQHQAGLPAGGEPATTSASGAVTTGASEPAPAASAAGGADGGSASAQRQAAGSGAMAEPAATIDQPGPVPAPTEPAPGPTGAAPAPPSGVPAPVPEQALDNQAPPAAPPVAAVGPSSTASNDGAQAAGTLVSSTRAVGGNDDTAKAATAVKPWLRNRRRRAPTSTAAGTSSNGAAAPKRKPRRRPRKKPPTAAPAPAPAPAAAMSEARQALCCKWGEVMFLLRKPVSSAEDVAGTAQAAKDGLVWLDEIDTRAEELGVLRGSLSRWLLPYDSNTPTLDQAAGATMAAEDGSVEAQLRAGGVEARLFEASISVEVSCGVPCRICSAFR